MSSGRRVLHGANHLCMYVFEFLAAEPRLSWDQRVYRNNHKISDLTQITYES